MSGSFYSEGTVTARKQHKCGDCGRTIEPGTQYVKTAGAVYGDFWTWKSCRHCHVLRQIVRAIDEDTYYDEDGFNLRDWFYDNNSPAEIRYHVQDPIKALGYYRIVRWYGDRWLDRNGQLREVPVLP